jgi:hypothetical protein
VRFHALGLLLALAAMLAACRPAPGKPALPTSVGQPPLSAIGTPLPPLARATPVLFPAPTRARGWPTSTSLLVSEPIPASGVFPTLADFWDGRARFVVDVDDTGLPMGESASVVLRNGEVWSYVHASQRSAGVLDSCGAAVEFPGCVVIYRSLDRGLSFALPAAPSCLIPCRQCPCEADVDHMVQQQYPRIFYDGQRAWMVYEYLGRVMMRTSSDGLRWSEPEHVADSVVWHLWHRDCPAEERIGEHPFAPFNYECLRGGPPGMIVADGVVYVFMAQGQNPGAMGCFKRRVDEEGANFAPCAHNPLFVGAADYGPLQATDAAANPFFDFRTISSAELQRLAEGDSHRYYMLYEGVRGPAAGDPGDTQFGLGLARSLTNAVDGAWEKYPSNPMLVDLPGNIGVGHADLVVLDGRTYLYTSLDGVTRSRLVLLWDAAKE